ncbi:hypothetical protein BJX76DRAFT_357822 [Aspergillus varians]
MPIFMVPSSAVASKYLNLPTQDRNIGAQTMPLYIRYDDGPDPAPPVPSWGGAALDIYMLENWEAPHLESPNDTPDERRRWLVRQFLNPGVVAREVEPPPSTKPYHEHEKEIGHGTYRYSHFTTEQCQNKAPRVQLAQQQPRSTRSSALSDRNCSDNDSYRAVLMLYPERVTNQTYLAEWESEWQELQLNKTREEEEEDEGWVDDLRAEWDPAEAFFEEAPRRQYDDYHEACVASHIFFVDRKAL